MRFPVTLNRDNLRKIILSASWFGFLPCLFFSLLPELVLGTTLLPWHGSLSLGFSLTLVLITLLQKYGYIDLERLLNTTVIHVVLVAALFGIYLLMSPVLQLLFAGRRPDANETLFAFLLFSVLVVRPLLDLIQVVVDRFVLRNRPDYQSCCAISAAELPRRSISLTSCRSLPPNCLNG